MNYKGDLPRDNDNVSHESPLKEFVILISGTLAILALLIYALGFAVNFAVDYLPYEQEAKIFESIPFEFENIIAADEKPQADERLQTLVDKLRKCSSLPVEIRAFTVASEDANAVALPGGKMLIFEGLFKQVQSENGLAFVLAHELGHFINRDHLKGMGRGMVLVVMSSLVTGPSSGLSRLLGSLMSLDTSHFSQQRESMADETALQILQCHYGHIGGATEFFKTQQAEQGHESGLSHYFSSHPQIKQRIENIQAWQNTHQAGLGETIPW